MDRRTLLVMISSACIAVGCASAGAARPLAHAAGGLRPLPLGDVDTVEVRRESPREQEGALPIAAFLRAELAAYGDNPEKVLVELNALISKLPNIGFLYYERAEHLAQMQRYEEALADLVRTAELNPDLIPAQLLRARILLATKRPTEAVAVLEAMRRKQPKEEEVYSLLARCYIQSHRLADAERTLKALVALAPESPAAYYYLGYLYGTHLKQPQRSEAMFLKVLDLQPDNMQVQSALAQLYLEQKRTHEALGLLLTIERASPDDPTLQLRIAVLYYELKEYPKAIQHFTSVLRKHPEADKLKYYLAVIHEESGKLSSDPAGVCLLQRRRVAHGGLPA
ncbi:MAG: tetratricopeptide repeat protein [Deltaproteobacteria bacterium]|nr:tetratricopeptide repeat protein [Deltaproteobacteria bacterium]